MKLWWTDWRQDGFFFDNIGFPLSVSSHQCSTLIFILILPLSEGHADIDWEPDPRKSIALLTMNFRIAEHCFVKNTLLPIGKHWHMFFFTFLRHKDFCVHFSQNFVNVYKIWGLHYSEDSFRGILNFNTMWTWCVLISISKEHTVWFFGFEMCMCYVLRRSSFMSDIKIETPKAYRSWNRKLS